jgi:hypothetical protein
MPWCPPPTRAAWPPCCPTQRYSAGGSCGQGPAGRNGLGLLTLPRLLLTAAFLLACPALPCLLCSWWCLKGAATCHRRSARTALCRRCSSLSPLWTNDGDDDGASGAAQPLKPAVPCRQQPAARAPWQHPAAAPCRTSSPLPKLLVPIPNWRPPHIAPAHYISTLHPAVSSLATKR